jgi:hypothetical protein
LKSYRPSRNPPANCILNVRNCTEFRGAPQFYRFVIDVADMNVASVAAAAPEAENSQFVKGLR